MQQLRRRPAARWRRLSGDIHRRRSHNSRHGRMQQLRRMPQRRLLSGDIHRLRSHRSRQRWRRLRRRRPPRLRLRLRLPQRRWYLRRLPRSRHQRGQRTKLMRLRQRLSGNVRCRNRLRSHSSRRRLLRRSRRHANRPRLRSHSRLRSHTSRRTPTREVRLGHKRQIPLGPRERRTGWRLVELPVRPALRLRRGRRDGRRLWQRDAEVNASVAPRGGHSCPATYGAASGFEATTLG
jgi:hypothetical protein